MNELLEYRASIFDSISGSAASDDLVRVESFFHYASELLANAGILDDVEYCPYLDNRKGVRIDGYSWNALEKTFCAIVVNYSNEPNDLVTLTNSQIESIGKRVTRFIENSSEISFVDAIELEDSGKIAATAIQNHFEDVVKFRVVLLTDNLLSTRVKKVSIDNILDKETSIEVWDLERIRGLDEAGSEFEEFTVDFQKLEFDVRALPANSTEQGVNTYLAVMPASLLSEIYHEHGQRLLESNVRTFLDFSSRANRGMRKSLLTEPERFFAYNNGLTITATAIETQNASGSLLIKSIENMQIVNGGQTTAAIYFSPRDKGGLRGEGGTVLSYSDIDLTNVFVQMKITVIGEKEKADTIKSKVAEFANTQNSIQLSDLESNHPFHLNIETRSRKQSMPAGENGLSTKWFYERTRGQYSTTLRALTGSKRRKFEADYPKRQLFTKTDMAKYENTWRMRPNEVKKGAQANLKLLGKKILVEFDKNSEQFGAAFYQDLVAKMILFRAVDSGLLSSSWYKEERGLKAEIVTYSIALLRHKLLEKDKDVDLAAIYKNQGVSQKLLELINSLARTIREHITNVRFTEGVTNPSEFCKSDSGWKKIQSIKVDIGQLGKGEILSSKEVDAAIEERQGTNKAAHAITGHEYVMSVCSDEWNALAEFNGVIYPPNHKNVAIPRKCVNLHEFGQVPSDRQMDLAKQIRDAAYQAGFDFI